MPSLNKEIILSIVYLFKIMLISALIV